MKTKIKVNDNVVVISGVERGRRGKVLHINVRDNRVIVEGINKHTKFMRPNQENPNGGSINREFPIHLSNVQYFCDKCKKGIKVKYSLTEKNTKNRVCPKCGKGLD